MEWISVEDDLPKQEKGSIYSRAVLAVSIDDGCIFVATYVHNSRSWYDFYQAPNGNIDAITHWMELPNAPNQYKIALGRHDFPTNSQSTTFP